MKIGVLTSSRADFGIYHPLINLLCKEPGIEVEIVAFGTHLKKEYGYTVEEIERLGYQVKHRIETETKNQEAADISYSIGKAVVSFSAFWKANKFDLVLALGDRYEMFAAVTAASPFGIDIAHIHAGETTLGAIDNAYRHSISAMSTYLFVCAEPYEKRAKEISDFPENVFNVGSLSVDNLKDQELYSIEAFKERFDLDLSRPTVLSTFHPETVSLENNKNHIRELLSAFDALREKYQLLITMPNADTLGDMIRHEIQSFAVEKSNIKLVESLGMKGYLSAMKHCALMIGNTSSGFVEASFFPKWVLNLGDRQRGRILTDNIIQTPITKEAILDAVASTRARTLPEKIGIYGAGHSARGILSKIKLLYGIG